MDRKFLRERGVTRRELARAALGGAAALCTLGGIPARSVFGRIDHAVAPPRTSNSEAGFFRKSSDMALLATVALVFPRHGRAIPGHLDSRSSALSLSGSPGQARR